MFPFCLRLTLNFSEQEKWLPGNRVKPVTHMFPPLVEKDLACPKSWRTEAILLSLCEKAAIKYRCHFDSKSFLSYEGQEALEPFLKWKPITSSKGSNSKKLLPITLRPSALQQALAVEAFGKMGLMGRRRWVGLEIETQIGKKRVTCTISTCHQVIIWPGLFKPVGYAKSWSGIGE